MTITNCLNLWQLIGWQLIGWQLIGWQLIGWQLIGWQLIGLQLIGWQLIGWQLIGLQLIGWLTVRGSKFIGLIIRNLLQLHGENLNIEQMVYSTIFCHWSKTILVLVAARLLMYSQIVLANSLITVCLWYFDSNAKTIKSSDYDHFNMNIGIFLKKNSEQM